MPKRIERCPQSSDPGHPAKARPTTHCQLALSFSISFVWETACLFRPCELISISSPAALAALHFNLPSTATDVQLKEDGTACNRLSGSALPFRNSLKINSQWQESESAACAWFGRYCADLLLTITVSTTGLLTNLFASFILQRQPHTTKTSVGK